MIITNEEFKKIVGIESYNDSMFKKESKIFLNFQNQENKKLLKISFRVETIEGYRENHYFEIETGLKMLEEILIFSAFEQKQKQNETKVGAFTFLDEREKAINEIFSFFNIKRTTYDDYLRKTSKDAYIKVKEYELFKLLEKLTGQHVPEYLIGRIRQEASKRKDNKLTVYFAKWTISEQDDRIIFDVSPNIFCRILTTYGHGCQDFIEEVLLEQSYDWNIIEKEELFERIDELNKVFKVKKDKKYFENKLDLISENFLVCPKETFLFEPTSVVLKSESNNGGLETLLSDSFKKFLNPSPFDLAGFKFETMNEWEVYKSKKEVDEKFEQAENDGNKEKPKFKIGKFTSPVMDNRSLKEIAEEITKETEGEKNNMDTNKNAKPKRPDSIMIDEENKVVVAFLNSKKIKVVCGKDDKFDFRIGLGVVVSKINDANKELQYLRQNMNWKQYYLYCYNKFFYFDANRIKAFENSVFAEQEQYKLKLDEEKVRKFRCEEVELSVYKPKKISHSFVLINK